MQRVVRNMNKAQEAGGFEKIEENRQALEDLAESDLPCARIATALLELEGEA
jgi:hypothetical protein